MSQKTIWTRVPNAQLPDAPADAATIVLSVTFRGKDVTRAITITQVGEDSFAGLVIRNGKITGMWRWNQRLFTNPVFISNMWVNEKGQKKRYAGGLPICNSIRNLILSYQEGERVAA